MDNCKISDNAIILRESVIKGNSRINENACIVDSIIDGDSMVTNTTVFSSVVTNTTVFSSKIGEGSHIKNANINRSKITSSNIVGNSYTERIKVPCNSIIKKGRIEGTNGIISIQCPTSFLLTNYYDKKISTPSINIILYFDKNDDILLSTGLTNPQAADSEILKLLFSFRDNSLSERERILFSFLLDSYNKVESAIKTETNCLINYLSKNVEDFKKKTARAVDLLTAAQMVLLVTSIDNSDILQNNFLDFVSFDIYNKEIKGVQNFCYLSEDIIKKISMPVPDSTTDSIWFSKVKDSIDAFSGDIIKL